MVRSAPFSRGGSPGRRYVITEEYVSGYVIVSAHATKTEAQRALAALEQQEREEKR